MAVVPLLLVGLASITDLMWQRIPNWLTLPAVVCAPFVFLAVSGSEGALFSLGGLLAGFCLLIGFYAVGGMAAGDVKLLAAVGAWVGPKQVFFVFLVSGLSGGVYALGLWLWATISGQGLSATFRSLLTVAKTTLLTGMPAWNTHETSATESFPKLRYALCIALGTFVAQLFLGEGRLALESFVHA